jgi:hypothetical protein
MSPIRGNEPGKIGQIFERGEHPVKVKESLRKSHHQIQRNALF